MLNFLKKESATNVTAQMYPEFLAFLFVIYLASTWPPLLWADIRRAFRRLFVLARVYCVKLDIKWIMFKVKLKNIWLRK